jgi:hypothetical protein
MLKLCKLFFCRQKQKNTQCETDICTTTTTLHRSGLDIILANTVYDVGGENCVQSVLSYDIGSSFTLIPADDLCHDSIIHCSMHFFGASQQFGAVYATSQAPGVLFGQGVAARCLPRTIDPLSVATYLSHDAGQHWTLLGVWIARQFY